MSGWTNKDEAQLIELLSRRRREFSELKSCVYMGLAPRVTTLAEHLPGEPSGVQLAEELAENVLDRLLAEGPMVAQLFSAMHPEYGSNANDDGWRRVIMLEETYQLTIELQNRQPGNATWEQALAKAVGVGIALTSAPAQFTSGGSTYYRMPDELAMRIEALVKKDGRPATEALMGAVTVAAAMLDYFASGVVYCTVKPGGIVAGNYSAEHSLAKASTTFDPEANTITFAPTGEEAKAISSYMRKKGLTNTGILRQALRMYDTVERALEDPSTGAVQIGQGSSYTAVPKG